jgi:cytochrome c oxidase cbb3-type subunit 1
VLAGMCLMAWNMYRTVQLARNPAPNPVLPPGAAEARA